MHRAEIGGISFLPATVKPGPDGKARHPSPALVRIAPGEPVATGWTLIDFGGSTENPDASHPILAPPWFKVAVTLAFLKLCAGYSTWPIIRGRCQGAPRRICAFFPASHSWHLELSVQLENSVRALSTTSRPCRRLFFHLGVGGRRRRGKIKSPSLPSSFSSSPSEPKGKCLNRQRRRRRRRRKEREEGGRGGVLNGAEGIERREGSPGGLKGVQIETKWAPNGLLLSATAPPLPPTPTPLLGPPTSIRPSALPSAAVNARAQS